MPQFWKNPKFIAGTILVLWVAYVIEENFKLDPITISLLPKVTLQFRVSAVIIGAAIFGSAVTLLIQFFWRRRSKNASSSAAPPASSSTQH